MKKNLAAMIFIVFVFACSSGNNEKGIELNAVDYGLTEGVDGTQAIIRALDDARQKNASKLIIPKGIYFFSNEKALEKYISISNNDNGLKRMVFSITGFNNFEIDANGSEFIFDGLLIPFVIEQSENITIKGLSIDWKSPLYGQAEVIANNKSKKTFDVKIDDEFKYEIHKGTLYFKTARGYHDTGKNLFFYPGKEGTVYNVDSYKLDPWGKWHSDSYEAKELKKGLVRITNRINSNLPEPGWIWVSKGTDELSDRTSPAIRIYKSFGIDLLNVTIYHSGAMGVIGEKSGDVTIENMKVIASPNTSRAVSTTADATHFVNCKGTIRVKNSYFANMLDDAINVHGIYTKIVDIIDEHTIGVKQIHVEQHGFDFAEAGDTIVVADNKTLLPVDTLVVKKYKWYNEEYQKITVSQPINKNVKVNFGVENASWSAGLEFVSSTVEKNRARGILFSTRGKVFVDGNTFSNMMAGISISGDNNYWFESGPSESVTISNNKFINCTTGGKGNSVIMIAPIITHPQLSDGYYLREINIMNNLFEAYDKQILFALSVERLNFMNNTIIHSNKFTALYPAKSTFEINSCRNINIENNNLNSFQNGSILIDKSSAEGLTISNNKNRTGQTFIKKEAKGLDKVL
ncbi:MAG: hypothetical protein JEY94_01465 [Melioribacteraceae bacterium]|nr:hypothetical protein [Melioribacteraceae bacterium]